MDNTEKLMLIGSLEKIFGSADSFVNYPIHDLREYEKKEIRSVFEGVSSTDSLRTIAEFSRRIHVIPKGNVFEQDSGPALWRVYRDILKFACLKDSDEPEPDIDEVPTPSGFEDQEAAYAAYEDNYFRLIKAYRKERELHADDPGWRTKLEPARLREISSLEREWVLKGSKNEIDRHHFERMLSKGKSHSLIWKKWSERFIDDLHVRSDLDGGQYASFSLFPDPFSESWAKFEADNVTDLKRLIPDNLKGIFKTEDLDWVESVSFEYLKVSISRPWFSPDLFDTDFWDIEAVDWPYRNTIIAKGKGIMEGICPAYISELVLVRKVKVDYRKRLIEKVLHEIESGVEIIGTPLSWLTNLISPEKEGDVEEEDFGIIPAAYVCRYVSESPSSNKPTT